MKEYFELPQTLTDKSNRSIEDTKKENPVYAKKLGETITKETDSLLQTYSEYDKQIVDLYNEYSSHKYVNSNLIKLKSELNGKIINTQNLIEDQKTKIKELQDSTETDDRQIQYNLEFYSSKNNLIYNLKVTFVILCVIQIILIIVYYFKSSSN